MTPEQKAFVDQCRLRAKGGEPVSMDEMKRFVVLVRGSRRAAIDASEASSAKGKGKRAAKQPIDTDDALAGLENF
jgi:hypothetical protein